MLSEGIKGAQTPLELAAGTLGYVTQASTPASSGSVPLPVRGQCSGANRHRCKGSTAGPLSRTTRGSMGFTSTGARAQHLGHRFQ